MTLWLETMRDDTNSQNFRCMRMAATLDLVPRAYNDNDDDDKIPQSVLSLLTENEQRHFQRLLVWLL